MAVLLDEVWAAIHDRRLLAPGEPMVLAVSGGLDSMVLLRLFAQIAPQQRWTPIVAHFNHGLRGRESNRDARFVQATALRLGWRAIAAGILERMPPS